MARTPCLETLARRHSTGDKGILFGSVTWTLRPEMGVSARRSCFSLMMRYCWCIASNSSMLALSRDLVDPVGSLAHPSLALHSLCMLLHRYVFLPAQDSFFHLPRRFLSGTLLPSWATSSSRVLSPSPSPREGSVVSPCDAVPIRGQWSPGVFRELQLPYRWAGCHALGLQALSKVQTPHKRPRAHGPVSALRSALWPRFALVTFTH